MYKKDPYSYLLIILKYSTLIFSLFFILIYLFLVFNRFAYQYELEWIEGASVNTVLRVLSGQEVYVEPSLEFVPLIYTPLYYYVSAIFAEFFGIGFLPLRLVSILASLGCFIILFEFVRRETKSIVFGIVSVGLFAATYRLSGAWFDIARVDSLFMFFLLWSLFLLRFYDSTKSLVFSGFLISLSFFTKQTALLIAICISFYCIYSLPKRSKYIFPLTFILIIGLSSFVLNLMSDGWYYYYVFELPKQHDILMVFFRRFWLTDMKYIFIAFFFSIVYIVTLFLNKRYKDFAFYALLFISMVTASCLSRMHSGGHYNVLIPAHAVISILFPIGVHVLTSKISITSNYIIQNNIFKFIVFAVCIQQFIFLIYDPYILIPSKEDSNAGDAFIHMLSNVNGEVLLPDQPFYPYLVGKKTYVHALSIGDVYKGDNDKITSKFEMQFTEAIRSEKFKMIILGGSFGRVKKEIEKKYVLEGEILNSKKSRFWPVTCDDTNPGYLEEIEKKYILDGEIVKNKNSHLWPLATPTYIYKLKKDNY